MNRCYLLGAGASHGYTGNVESKPPLTNYIFPKAFELGFFDRDYYKPILQYLKDYLNIEHISDPGDLKCDTETVLKDIHQGIFGESRTITSWPERTGQNQALLSLSYYLLYDLFGEYTTRYDHGSNNYTKLAEHLNPEEDFVISLNYDILLEQAIIDTQQEYLYPGFKGNTGVKIMKPHGSINWIEKGESVRSIEDDYPCIFPGLNKKSENFVRSVRDTYTHKYGYGKDKVLKTTRISDFDSKNLVFNKPEPQIYRPIIMPPLSKYKDSSISDKYTSSWEYAQLFLEEISELVIIGSQIREEDEMLCEILRSSIPSGTRVEIYTGSSSQKVGNRLGEMLTNPIINNHNSYFDSYIESLV